MAKNFKDISDTPINDTDLSRLDLHILGRSYLKEGISRFTEVTTEDKVQEIAEKPEVSNSQEEKKRRATLQKEKKNTRTTACLSAGCLRKSSATVLVSNMSALSASSESSKFVPSSSVPSTSAGSAGST